MKIEVEGKFPLTFRKIFYPTVRNATNTTRVISLTQDHNEMGYAWIEIHHANHSIEKAIMTNNVNEIRLIKKDSIPWIIHISEYQSGHLDLLWFCSL